MFVPNTNPSLVLLEVYFDDNEDHNDPGEVSELPIVAWEVGTFPDVDTPSARPVSLYSFSGKEGVWRVVSAVLDKFDDNSFYIEHNPEREPELEARTKAAITKWLKEQDDHPQD